MGRGLCSLPASCIHPCVGLWVLPEPPTKNGQHRAEQGSCCPKTSRSDSEGSLGKNLLKQLLLNAGGIIFFFFWCCLGHKHKEKVAVKGDQSLSCSIV